MNTSIQKALEHGLTEKLRSWSVSTALASIPIYEGQSDQERKLPCVVCVADRIVEHPELQHQSWVYQSTITISLLTQVDDENIEQADLRLMLLEQFVSDDQLTSAWSDELRIYNIDHTGIEQTSDDRHWINTIILELICQPLD